MIRIYWIYITLLIFLVSCASLPQKVQKNILNKEFGTALLVLEEKGVGAEIKGSPKEKELQARKIYSEGVYDYYKHVVENLNETGHARKAYNKALEAQRFCPWSLQIAEIVKNSKTLVNKINESQKKWRYLSSVEKLSVTDARHIIKDVQPIGNYISDTPLLTELLNKASSTIILYWSSYILSKGVDLNLTDYKVFVSEINRLPQNIDGKKSFFDALLNLIKLSNYETISKNNLTTLNKEEIDAIYYLVKHFSLNKEYRHIYPCNNSIREVFKTWCKKEFVFFLENPKIDFETILVAEYFFKHFGSIEPIFRTAIAKAHLNFATKKSTKGKSALLSLLNLRRINDLGVYFDKQKLKNVYRTCLLTLNSTNKLSALISINSESEISPILFNLLSSFIYSEVETRTKNHFKWIWSRNPINIKSDVDIHINKITLHSPSLNALQSVTSSYLSHFEDVQNPMKSYYKSMVDSAKWSVNMAESNYNSAVSSHNIYPTQYSLNNANNAYTSYKYAIDNYNSLVRTYNSTPSTISRKVYLPYSFKQGTIQSGWEVLILCIVNNKSYTFSKKEIETDFVRLGSKYNDKNTTYRKDDYIDINTSTEYLVKTLDKIISEGCDELGKLLFNLDYNIPFSSGIEKEIFCKISHPFGFKYASKYEKFDSWLQNACSYLVVPSEKISPKKISLKLSKNISTENLERFVGEYEKFVCMVISEFSKGSGTLISGNGLILTCAHVLMGSKINVIFNSNFPKKTYDCEIVFIDEKNDVALIKAKNFKSTRWANIRLRKPPVKGEKIVAIGNPALANASSTNISGASSGIVSNPTINSQGTTRMVADITIASGSSGGPIFSLKTGELIGIVSAVGSSGFNIDNTNISSSGYFCLAAPSNKFSDWLSIY